MIGSPLIAYMSACSMAQVWQPRKKPPERSGGLDNT